jgi:hypothetical protein
MGVIGYTVMNNVYKQPTSMIRVNKFRGGVIFQVFDLEVIEISLFRYGNETNQRKVSDQEDEMDTLCTLYVVR